MVVSWWMGVYEGGYGLVCVGGGVRGGGDSRCIIAAVTRRSSITTVILRSVSRPTNLIIRTITFCFTLHVQPGSVSNGTSPSWILTLSLQAKQFYGKHFLKDPPISFHSFFARFVH